MVKRVFLQMVQIYEGRGEGGGGRGIHSQDLRIYFTFYLFARFVPPQVKATVKPATVSSTPRPRWTFLYFYNFFIFNSDILNLIPSII